MKAGIKPATVNRDHDRLRSALNQAVRWKLIPNNPLAGIKHLTVEESNRVRYLSVAEEKRLRDALLAREAERRRQRISGNAWAAERGHELRPVWADDDYTDHLMPMTLLVLNLGLRRGELLGLMKKSVDLERKIVTVEASTAKNQKTRHIPLNAEALDVLKRWLRYHGDGDLVFPGADGDRMTHINRSWAGLMKAAKLTDFHFHDCRHHFASWLVMGGVELNTVRELMGHSKIEMTLRYAHLAPEHKAAAVEVLGRR